MGRTRFLSGDPGFFPLATFSSASWTLGETARRLGISPRSLARLVASGDLKVVRLSTRSVRVRPSDLETYIESRVGR